MENKAFGECAKDLISGVDFGDLALTEKIKVAADPLINDIMLDAGQMIKEIAAGVTAGDKDKNIAKGLGGAAERIRGVVARRLKLDPNSPEVKKILGAKLDPQKVSPELAKNFGKNADGETFIDILGTMQKNYITGKLAEAEQQDKDKDKNKNAAAAVSAEQGKQSADKGEKKQGKGKRSSGGGGSKMPGEPSFRGLDSSRISKMVKDMFKDIQTMGFATAYLGENSTGWVEAAEREKEREVREEEEKRKRKDEAAAEEEEEEDDEQEEGKKQAKLSKPTIKKNGKELQK